MEIPTTTLAIFAIVAAMGLIGVVGVTILSVLEDAEARGCPLVGPAPNASKLRCFRP